MGQCARYGRSLAWTAVDLEGPPDEARPVLHSPESHAPLTGIVGLKPNAVVFNSQLKVLCLRGKDDLDVIGLGVAGGVVH